VARLQSGRLGLGVAALRRRGDRSRTVGSEGCAAAAQGGQDRAATASPIQEMWLKFTPGRGCMTFTVSAHFDETHSSIVGSRENDDWEMKIWGPDQFERS
jgi:hypothetical protein